MDVCLSQRQFKVGIRNLRICPWYSHKNGLFARLKENTKFAFTSRLASVLFEPHVSSQPKFRRVNCGTDKSSQVIKLQGYEIWDWDKRGRLSCVVLLWRQTTSAVDAAISIWKNWSFVAKQKHDLASWFCVGANLVFNSLDLLHDDIK